MDANAMIDEILAGIYEGLDGREPNAAIAAKIKELEAEKAENARSGWHGWECYCYSCCM